jgi:predicted DNA-binding ribbon-helix-helix protein
MNIGQIITWPETWPITTRGYPDPAEARRYLDDPDGFYGYDYVFLEDATWNALCDIACERGCTVDELCKEIEFNFAPDEDFAPAARRYVLRYIDQVPDNIELPANFPTLTELLNQRRTKSPR